MTKLFIAIAALMLTGSGNAIAADNTASVRPPPPPTAVQPNCCPSRSAVLAYAVIRPAELQCPQQAAPSVSFQPMIRPPYKIMRDGHGGRGALR